MGLIDHSIQNTPVRQAFLKDYHETGQPGGERSRGQRGLIASHTLPHNPTPS